MAAAPVSAPATSGRWRRTSHTHPHSAAITSRSLHAATNGCPYHSGTACAFQTPPSIRSDPTVPNGVSARGANRSTAAGSVRAPLSSAGISHGRLTTSRPPATFATAAPAVHGRHRRPGRPPRATAAGKATTADSTTEENPPTAAGTSATTSRDRRAERTTAPRTHGSPAYPSSIAHCPSSSRSATKGFHT
ncbi:hypothetical protein NORO109296_10020 [Nocardiopsis rhodophaea]